MNNIRVELPNALLADVLNCTICFEFMDNPVTLWCGHTFCFGCFNAHYKNRSTCPTCSTKSRMNGPITAIMCAVSAGLRAQVHPLEGKFQRYYDQWCEIHKNEKIMAMKLQSVNATERDIGTCESPTRVLTMARVNLRIHEHILQHRLIPEDVWEWWDENRHTHGDMVYVKRSVLSALCGTAPRTVPRKLPEHIIKWIDGL